MLGREGSLEFGDDDMDNLDASGLNMTTNDKAKDAAATKTSL